MVEVKNIIEIYFDTEANRVDCRVNLAPLKDSEDIGVALNHIDDTFFDLEGIMDEIQKILSSYTDEKEPSNSKWEKEFIALIEKYSKDKMSDEK
jgi:hypothetical protein